MQINKFKLHTIVMAIMIVCSTVFISGCVNKQQESKDDFFKEWQAKAEVSQPYLPKRDAFIADTKLQQAELKTVTKEPAVDKEITKADDLMRRLPSQLISVRFVDDQIQTVLRTLARIANQNILLSPNVKGTINTHITDTPWNKVFMSIVQNYNLVATKEDNLLHVMSLGDIKEKISRQSLEIEAEQVSPLVTELIAIEYSKPSEIATSLNLLLSKDAAGAPRGSVSVDSHTSSLIIRDTTDNMNNLLKLVYDLDKPTPQVLIKAHIIETTKDTARELGVRWGGSTNAGSQRFGDFSYTVASDFLGEGALLGITGAGADITLDVHLSALQSAGKINILSSPSIATLDNNQAIIESGTTIPYPSGTDDLGQIIYSQAEATLKLTVTPHVISGESIKLEIEAQKDEVDATRTVGGTPYVLTKNAKTNLIVQNSATVVIAGLTKEKTSTQNDGVPMLMDIPIIGGLFKASNTGKEFEDLLIFITPTILSKTKQELKDAR